MVPVLCLACSPASSSQLNEPIEQASTADQACLRLEPSRADPVLGEPVLLIVGLENCSSNSLVVRKLLAPEKGLLQIKATAPDGEQLIYRPPLYRDGRGARSVQLAPGETHIDGVAIYYGSEGWFLNRSGRWRFTAQYSSEWGLLSSEPVELWVKEPTSPEQLLTARIFMKDEVARFFYMGGDDQKAAQAIQDSLPESTWRKFADLAVQSNNPDATQFDLEILASLPDAAIAAAVAGDLRDRTVPHSIKQQLLDKSSKGSLVAKWIEQRLPPEF